MNNIAGALYRVIKIKKRKKLKSQSNEPYTDRCDGWAVIFGTAMRGLGGLRPRPVPFSLYQM